MNKALTRLAHAMLLGASLGCRQVQNTYVQLLGDRADGSCEYGFCAIGFANIGVLGYIPENIDREVQRHREHFMGREPLQRALGVDWDMLVTLPNDSQHSLLGAVSMLNDKACWSVPHIAAWLLMLASGWTSSSGKLHVQGVGRETISLEIETFLKRISFIEHEYWHYPDHEVWKEICDPMWWFSRGDKTNF